MKTFIPKEHPELPDNYSVTVFFKTQTSTTFEVASHVLNWEMGLFELRTTDDEIVTIRLSAIRYLHWDKRFSKVVDIRTAMKAEEKAKEVAENPVTPPPTLVK